MRISKTLEVFPPLLEPQQIQKNVRTLLFGANFSFLVLEYSKVHLYRPELRDKVLRKIFKLWSVAGSSFLLFVT
jgi:hypothetical protein